MAKAPTLQQWLAVNPRAWDGWPTRSLWLDDFDTPRLRRMLARMPADLQTIWFRHEHRPDAMYAAISSEVADLRLLRRRAYLRSVAV